MIALLAVFLLAAAAPLPPGEVGARIQVPLDHEHPDLGQASLYYEMGAPFDPNKPTQFVVADGQQFYVRKGAMARIQREDFGDAFNVVGIVGRGATPAFIDAALAPDGKPDWAKAWRLFRSDQWVEDIEAVRVALAGDGARVLLYGVSGGALLVQQYLAKHGDRVARAFIAAPVNPFLVGRLGLKSDRFWEEIGRTDPTLQKSLREALDRRAADRPEVIMTLQRQNFFVPPERLASARADLIRALETGDEARYAQAKKEYQVDEIRSFFDSKEGIPIRVREYEFFEPSGAAVHLQDDGVHPDLENQRNFARQLLDLRAAGRIPAPELDVARFHSLQTEVFILAGRWDHTVGYRSAIELAACFPKHLLFLADADHMFASMAADGSRKALARAFLRFGLGSRELDAVLTQAAPHRWVEK